MHSNGTFAAGVAGKAEMRSGWVDNSEVEAGDIDGQMQMIKRRAANVQDVTSSCQHIRSVGSDQVNTYIVLATTKKLRQYG